MDYFSLVDEVSILRSTMGYSERKIALELNISKSEVHRLVELSKLPLNIREAAGRYGTEKWLLLDLIACENNVEKAYLTKAITLGKIIKRQEWRDIVQGKYVPKPLL
jgi:hypothetical protein